MNLVNVFSVLREGDRVQLNPGEEYLLFEGESLEVILMEDFSSNGPEYVAKDHSVKVIEQHALEPEPKINSVPEAHGLNNILNKDKRKAPSNSKSGTILKVPSRPGNKEQDSINGNQSREPLMLEASPSRQPVARQSIQNHNDSNAIQKDQTPKTTRGKTNKTTSANASCSSSTNSINTSSTGGGRETGCGQSTVLARSQSSVAVTQQIVGMEQPNQYKIITSINIGNGQSLGAVKRIAPTNSKSGTILKVPSRPENKEQDSINGNQSREPLMLEASPSRQPVARQPIQNHNDSNAIQKNQPSTTTRRKTNKTTSANASCSSSTKSINTGSIGGGRETGCGQSTVLARSQSSVVVTQQIVGMEQPNQYKIIALVNIGNSQNSTIPVPSIPGNNEQDSINGNQSREPSMLEAPLSRQPVARQSLQNHKDSNAIQKNQTPTTTRGITNKATSASASSSSSTKSINTGSIGGGREKGCGQSTVSAGSKSSSVAVTQQIMGREQPNRNEINNSTSLANGQSLGAVKRKATTNSKSGKIPKVPKILGNKEQDSINANQRREPSMLEAPPTRQPVACQSLQNQNDSNAIQKNQPSTTTKGITNKATSANASCSRSTKSINTGSIGGERETGCGQSTVSAGSKSSSVAVTQQIMGREQPNRNEINNSTSLANGQSLGAVKRKATTNSKSGKIPKVPKILGNKEQDSINANQRREPSMLEAPPSRQPVACQSLQNQNDSNAIQKNQPSTTTKGITNKATSANASCSRSTKSINTGSIGGERETGCGQSTVSAGSKSSSVAVTQQIMGREQPNRNDINNSTSLANGQSLGPVKRKATTNSKSGKIPKVPEILGNKEQDSINANQSREPSMLEAPPSRQPVACQSLQNQNDSNAIQKNQPSTATKGITNKATSANESCSRSTKSINTGSIGGERKTGCGQSTVSAGSKSSSVAVTQEIVGREQPNRNEINNSTSLAKGQSLGALFGVITSLLRSRRNCLAELAARCPTDGVVDFISNPFPLVERVFPVSADASCSCSTNSINTGSTGGGKETGCGQSTVSAISQSSSVAVTHQIMGREANGSCSSSSKSINTGSTGGGRETGCGHSTVLARSQSSSVAVTQQIMGREANASCSSSTNSINAGSTGGGRETGCGQMTVSARSQRSAVAVAQQIMGREANASCSSSTNSINTGPTGGGRETGCGQSTVLARSQSSSVAVTHKIIGREQPNRNEINNSTRLPNGQSLGAAKRMAPTNSNSGTVPKVPRILGNKEQNSINGNQSREPSMLEAPPSTQSVARQPLQNQYDSNAIQKNQPPTTTRGITSKATSANASCSSSTNSINTGSTGGGKETGCGQSTVLARSQRSAVAVAQQIMGREANASCSRSTNSINAGSTGGGKETGCGQSTVLARSQSSSVAVTHKIIGRERPNRNEINNSTRLPNGQSLGAAKRMAPTNSNSGTVPKVPSRPGNKEQYSINGNQSREPSMLEAPPSRQSVARQPLQNQNDSNAIQKNQPPTTTRGITSKATSANASCSSSTNSINAGSTGGGRETGCGQSTVSARSQRSAVAVAQQIMGREANASCSRSTNSINAGSTGGGKETGCGQSTVLARSQRSSVAVTQQIMGREANASCSSSTNSINASSTGGGRETGCGQSTVLARSQSSSVAMTQQIMGRGVNASCSSSINSINTGSTGGGRETSCGQSTVSARSQSSSVAMTQQIMGREAISSCSSCTNSINIGSTGCGIEIGCGQSTVLARSQSSSAAVTQQIMGREQPNRNEINNSTSLANGQSLGALSGQNPNDVRSRRNRVAELAARCPTVGVVDLISSPFPRVEGQIDITLDSDEERENRPNMTAKPLIPHDPSFDEENPELSIKVMWNCKLEHFTLRKYQKFDSIFEKLSELKKLEKSNILLNLESQVITQNDTPASIKYKFFQFIYGRAMMNSSVKGSSSVGKTKRDPNLLKLKVQSDKWKKPIIIELQKAEKFKILIIKCAEKLKMPYEKIQLRFDGELLKYDETPADLAFEGGEVLEIYFND